MKGCFPPLFISPMKNRACFNYTTPKLREYLLSIKMNVIQFLMLSLSGLCSLLHQTDCVSKGNLFRQDIKADTVTFGLRLDPKIEMLIETIPIG